jgi:hypothetical protein
LQGESLSAMSYFECGGKVCSTEVKIRMVTFAPAWTLNAGVIANSRGLWPFKFNRLLNGELGLLQCTLPCFVN